MFFCSLVLPKWTMSSPKGVPNNNMVASFKYITLRNLPEPTSGTYTSTPRNPPEPSANLPEPSGPSGSCLRNLHQHLPELSRTGAYTSTHWSTHRNPQHTGTLRNLPEPAPELPAISPNLPPEPTPAHTGTLRNFPEPAPHQHMPELSGTFRNKLPEPKPPHTGTFRNLREPSSGTCSCDSHRHTPELIWAEDPISLRCWGITHEAKKISFGDIPNSSSIDILMPWAPFCAMVLPMWTMLSA